MTTYVLKPRPPLRAFVISAGAAAAGVLFALVGGNAGWPAVLVGLGWVLLVAGVALAVLGLLSVHRARVFVDLDESGYAITGATRGAYGEWAKISRVTQTTDGSRLTFVDADGERTSLVSPFGAGDAVMGRLATDVAKRLDANRGYRQLT